MSQDFKKGMPLIDGHGNFGNIEGRWCRSHALYRGKDFRK